jgi:hypothetical protein
MSRNCPPPPDIGVTDPCSMLPKLRSAYYALLGGQATATIRDRDRWIEFQQGNVRLLQTEIRKLEALCPAGSGNPLKPEIGAVRAGPYHAPGTYPGFHRTRRY